jgi:hypothetical protein
VAIGLVGPLVRQGVVHPDSKARRSGVAVDVEDLDAKAGRDFWWKQRPLPAQAAARGQRLAP